MEPPQLWQGCHRAVPQGPAHSVVTWRVGQQQCGPQGPATHRPLPPISPSLPDMRQGRGPTRVPPPPQNWSWGPSRVSACQAGRHLQEGLSRETVPSKLLAKREWTATFCKWFPLLRPRSSLRIRKGWHSEPLADKNLPNRWPTST